MTAQRTSLSNASMERLLYTKLNFERISHDDWDYLEDEPGINPGVDDRTSQADEAVDELARDLDEVSLYNKWLDIPQILRFDERFKAGKQDYPAEDPPLQD